jgi:hypothetical protein
MHTTAGRQQVSTLIYKVHELPVSSASSYQPERDLILHMRNQQAETAEPKLYHPT